MTFRYGHAGYMILLVMLGISGDIKPTWRGLIACLLFDAGRFVYHQIMETKPNEHKRRA